MTCKSLFVDELGWSCRKNYDSTVGVKCNGKQHNECMEYQSVEPAKECKHLEQISNGYTAISVCKKHDISDPDCKTDCKKKDKYIIALSKKQIDYLIELLSDELCKLDTKILKKLRGVI